MSILQLISEFDDSCAELCVFVRNASGVDRDLSSNANFDRNEVEGFACEFGCKAFSRLYEPGDDAR
jgi:hypothetical protein